MNSVKTVCVTLPILGLNFLIDSGKQISIDEAKAMIDSGDVFESIQNRFGHIDGFEVILADYNLLHKTEIVEALQRISNAYVANDFQVENNGLNYILGMLNELIQQGSETLVIR